MDTAMVRSIADAVVTKIAAYWTPTSPNAVSRSYMPSVENLKALTGRKVYVWFKDFGQIDTATKVQDRNSYTIVVGVVEKCTEVGYPTNTWIDERVDFVAEMRWRLGEVRGTLFPSPLNEVLPGSSDRARAPDENLLREENLFVNYLEFTYELDEVNPHL